MMKPWYIHSLLVILVFFALINIASGGIEDVCKGIFKGESKGICTTTQELKLTPPDVRVAAGILVTIQLLIAALAYIFAGATASGELKAWGRNEIMQAVFTLILIATYFGVVAIADSALSDMVSKMETGENLSVAQFACFNNESYRWSISKKCNGENEERLPPPEKAEDRANFVARAYPGLVYERLGEILNTILHGLFAYNSMDSMGFSLTIAPVVIDPFGISFGASYPFHAVIITVLQNMSELTVKMLMMIKFQEAILIIVGPGGLGEKILLLGILFRCIWFLRKAGGLLIALGIGLMLVLPFLYMLGWYTIDINPFKRVFDKKDTTDIIKESSSIPELIQNGLLLVSLGAVGALKILATGNPFAVSERANGLRLGIDTVFGAILFRISLLTPDITPDDLFSDLGCKNEGKGCVGYFDLLSRYLIVAIAFPLINLYLLLAFVKGLSPLLGGDHDIPGLSRLI